jgi:anthranilate phosphoribosyltransferase
MKEYLQKLLLGLSLTKEEAYQALLFIGEGRAASEQIAAFLMGIQMKKITVSELMGFRKAMLDLAISFDFSAYDAMDVCGTGGDGKDTFNISTTAAFIVAGAGQKVAKHGNHGVSSAVGSSTVLEYLGVPFTNDESILRDKIETANICYLHAPLFHPAMRFVGPVRKTLGVKTFFNILGPLLNPVRVTKQLTGVYNEVTFDIYEALFKTSGGTFGILHALDGYDEISLTGDFLLATHSTSKKQYTPNDLGFENVTQEALHGGATLEDSAQIVLNVLQNQATVAQTHAAIANAGVALAIAQDTSLVEGIEKAKESVQSGRAYQALQKLVEA